MTDTRKPGDIYTTPPPEGFDPMVDDMDLWTDEQWYAEGRASGWTDEEIAAFLDASDPNSTPDLLVHSAGTTVRVRVGYSEEQARDDHGRFGEGGGDTKTEDTVGPIKVTSADEALALLAEGKQVDLPEDQVGTMLDKLAEIGRQAKESGEKAPLYNLCDVSVSDTNVFCGGNAGVPRLEMPQLKGEPEPGSKADGMAKDDKGEVDLAGAFRDSLEAGGATITDGTRDASMLKASQTELNGAKVAGMMQAADAGKLDIAGERLFVSKDGYIVDGHHRWAAEVAREFVKSGDPIPISVATVDMGIVELLAKANEFAADMGITSKAAAVNVIAIFHRAVERRDVRSAAITEPLVAPFPVPDYPQREWFTTKPSYMQPGQGLTIDDDGRVSGYFFDADGPCLMDGSNECWKPGPSLTGYAIFHQQDVVVADGDTVRCGAIGLVHGHADERLNASAAQAKYADPECQRIVACAYDDDHGAYILGALVPGLTYGDVAQLRRCGLSGDWRPMHSEWWRVNGISASAARTVDGYDCVGPTLVTRPGLPLIRAYRGAVADRPVYLGGLAGVDPTDELEAPMSDTNLIVRLQDGTEIEVPQSGPNGAHTAAPLPAGGPVPGSPADPVMGDQTDGSGTPEERIAALEEKVDTLAEMVHQLVGEAAAQQDQAVVAALADLDAAEIVLPD